mgnify:FL=1
MSLLGEENKSFPLPLFIFGDLRTFFGAEANFIINLQNNTANQNNCKQFQQKGKMKKMGHSIDTIRNDPRNAFFRFRKLAVNWKGAGRWMN